MRRRRCDYKNPESGRQCDLTWPHEGNGGRCRAFRRGPEEQWKAVPLEILGIVFTEAGAMPIRRSEMSPAGRAMKGTVSAFALVATMGPRMPWEE